MDEKWLKERLEKAIDDRESFLIEFLVKGLRANGVVDDWYEEMYARSLIDLGRYQEASVLLEELQRTVPHPSKPWIISRRAMLEKEQGNYDVAFQIWMEAHEMSPDEASFLIFAARIAFRMGKIEQAIELARVGTECSEGHTEEAWCNLAGYLATQNRHREALDCLDRAVEIDPDYDIAILKRKQLLELQELAGNLSCSAGETNSSTEQGADDQLPARCDSKPE